jgi:hypothetical protein
MPGSVSLQAAAPGERVLRPNHRHLHVDTPCRADGPVYGRKPAVPARPAPG